MASKPEQRAWRNRLKPVLDQIPSLEYERIELSTGANGMPDLLVSYHHGPLFIENKWADHREGMVDLSGWAKGQRSWAKRHGKIGTVTLLFVATDEANYLIDTFDLFTAQAIADDHVAILCQWKVGQPWPVVAMKRALSILARTPK